MRVKSSLLEAINNQIEMLKQVVSTHLLMPSIIVGDFDDITELQAINIQEK
jgi:thiamine pyrophosphokinase